MWRRLHPRSYARKWWKQMPESFIMRGNKSAADPACDRTNRLTETLIDPGLRLMTNPTKCSPGACRNIERPLYHGGFAGLSIGDWIEPAPPPVFDGCPVCVARAEGRVYTVGEYRCYLADFGDRAKPILDMLEGEPDYLPVDPPRAHENSVYVTSSHDYARWYAARARGDLYEVEPLEPSEQSGEDVFPTWVASRALVVRVVERNVRLDRKFRRALFREWGKRERRRLAVA